MKLGGKIIDRGLHGLDLCLRLDQFLSFACSIASVVDCPAANWST